MSTPQNYLRFGAHYRQNSEIYHPNLRKLFFRNVFDPGFYLRTGFDTENLCIPACVLISLHKRLGQGLSKLGIGKFCEHLKCLVFEDLLTTHRVGLSLEQMNIFEGNHIPIPTSLLKIFPTLSFFSGLSINFFRIRRNGQNFSIFPFALSPHARDHSFFQIDLLIETDDIFLENKCPLTTGNSTLHCLAITRLCTLLWKFPTKPGRYIHICRTCFQMFRNRELIKKHELACEHRKRGVKAYRRKSNNILLHQPFKLNKFTGKTMINGLTFERAKLYTLLKPLSLAFLDFESYNTPVSDSTSFNPNSCVYEGVPNTAVFSQCPMSFCYLLQCLYQEQHPLPDYLRDIRLGYCKEQTAGAIKDFFLGLLLDIRKDLENQGRFLAEVVSSDPGVPTTQTLSTKDRINFFSAKFCQICGKRFGSHYIHPKTKKKIYIQKCKDHDHFLRYL